MRTRSQQARLAAGLYLLMCVLGLPGLILIPGKLIVHGDATATADHLRAASTLFRVGIASELTSVLFIYVGLALYRLFADVDRDLALQMVVLVVLSVPIVFLNAVFELGALMLVSPSPFLAPFANSQLDALAYFLLRLRGAGYDVVWVFWALWLVPFGLLVMRSGFLPKILGVLLLIAALGDLLRVVARLFPAADGLDSVGGILGLGELPIMFWLLIAGAREEPARVGQGTMGAAGPE